MRALGVGRVAVVVSGVMAVAASARCGPEAAKKVGKGEGEETVVVVKVGEDAGRQEAGQGRVRDEEGRGGGWY